MNEDQIRFKVGQKVKHKLRDRIMIVVDLDVVMPVIKLGTRNNVIPPATYTGKIWCSWADDTKLSPEKALFSQDELEEVE
jgi:hypothetical protein